MNLQERMQSFVGWMQRHALKGFREYAEDTYSDDYNSLEDVLLSIASDMKTAVRFNNAEEYIAAEGLYKQYFDTINEELAKTHYGDLLDDLLDSGLSNLDGQIMAVSELWKNPIYRIYLPVTVEMPNPKTGEVLHLVGSHEHGKGKHPYVTADEVEMLKSDFRDPWEYVRNREARHVEDNKAFTNP